MAQTRPRIALALRSSQRFTEMTIGVRPFLTDVDVSIHQVDDDALLSWAMWLWDHTVGPHRLIPSLIPFLVTSCLSSPGPGEEITRRCSGKA
jgi:hypothetical protein